MNKSSARAPLAIFITLTAATWGLVIWEIVQHGRLSMLAAVNAAMFTGMLLAWPFVNGARVSHGHVQRAAMCVECRALRWPTEATIGFCLRCGSSRAAVVAGY